ncbi:hypothetical protein HYPSUDRAFT_334505 [Hypholoma sublateritium FD-334 SS-4]|uniref:Uncharacterized protein n=1 Tax=Hypholoma sublateritium (strain FD-334 SS-4) TaxID=945553 RepID=A0A0D2N9W0_HYPSF|nr:hypothetical protein HYPSUDRAFT_334505 [Hypholoma sublateritium FD-334 SS-4]
MDASEGRRKVSARRTPSAAEERRDIHGGGEEYTRRSRRGNGGSQCRTQRRGNDDWACSSSGCSFRWWTKLERNRPVKKTRPDQQHPKFAQAMTTRCLEHQEHAPHVRSMKSPHLSGKQTLRLDITGAISPVVQSRTSLTVMHDL